MRKLAFLMLAFLFSGCISISTHERMMKDCRKLREDFQTSKSEQLEMEKKNKELEEKLVQESSEGETLREQLTTVRSTYDDLVNSLKDEIAAGDIDVKETETGFNINMGNKILFKSGSDQVQPKGQRVLTIISRSLVKMKDSVIQVQGHTDNVPISGTLKERFESNWNLSASRAASVVYYLQVKGGVPPENLVLSAFAEYRPVESNSTRQGRELNRRVEIVVLPKSKGESGN